MPEIGDMYRFVKKSVTCPLNFWHMSLILMHIALNPVKKIMFMNNSGGRGPAKKS
jgi:hypothetical protein